jgi:hypothetical protein
MRLQLNVICDEAVPYVVPIIEALAMSTTLETFDVRIVWRGLARLLFIDVQQSIESMLASSQTLQHLGLVVQCTNKFFGDGDNEAGEMCQDANLRTEELFFVSLLQLLRDRVQDLYQRVTPWAQQVLVSKLR